MWLAGGQSLRSGQSRLRACLPGARSGWAVWQAVEGRSALPVGLTLSLFTAIKEESEEQHLPSRTAGIYLVPFKNL